MREALSDKAVTQLKDQWLGSFERWDHATLALAARHSMNRAGLIVAGGVAPALASLRAQKASDAEVSELLRFASSERYLQWRQRSVTSGF